jgi:hypothetical protein
VASRLELETRRRSDGYFEALIVPKTDGGAVIVTVTFTAGGAISARLLPRWWICRSKFISRSSPAGKWYVDKQRLVMTAGEVAAALKTAGAGHRRDKPWQ